MNKNSRTFNHTPDDQYFLCAGYIDDCELPIDVDYGDGKYTDVAKLEGNTLTMHFEYIEMRYVLAFTPDKFIYRYQEKDCLISYPHGCLIDTFSWHDIGSYEIKKLDSVFHCAPTKLYL